MANFYLQTNYAKPGDTVTISGACVDGSSIFTSSDEKIAYFSTPTTLSVVGVGEINIKDDSLIPTCSNTGGILFTSTEDGKPPFMSKDDYTSFTNYEGIFVFFLLLSAFIIRFAKKS